MKKQDYQLLEEAYSATQPDPGLILEYQLQETIDIIREGMWDRLKSDASGAMAGGLRKGVGTVGRALTGGLGGKWNPFNKMVAKGRQAGQEARAASLGGSHAKKMTGIMTKISTDFEKAIDSYMNDMQKQGIIQQGQAAKLTGELKNEFQTAIQNTQTKIDGLTTQSKGYTATDAATGKTVGGSDVQTVGGQAHDSTDTPYKDLGTSAVKAAGDGLDAALAAPGKALNKVTQTAADATNSVFGNTTTGKDNILKRAKDKWNQARNAPVPEGSDEPYEEDEEPYEEAEEEEKEENEEVVEDNRNPLEIELPYTTLNESNTQDYIMDRGWRSRQS
jgi:hypothetical protein